MRGNTTGRLAGRAIVGLATGALALTGLAATVTTANAAAPGYIAKSALINGDTVSADVGILKSGSPISLEQYAAERAGFAVTVVSGEAWATMTAADFAKYQVLIVGDDECNGLSESVANWDTWAPVVMGTTPANNIRGNRVLSGLDPSYHFQEGDGRADPTDPANPATAGAEHFVEASIRFAGATPGATGLYFSPGCFSDDEVWDTIGNKLAASGTGFTTQADTSSMDDVHLVRTPGATFSGLESEDLPEWDNTAHTYFDAFPADFRPLAIATDVPDDEEEITDSARTAEERNGDGPRNGNGPKSAEFSAAADDSTCAVRVLTGTNVCGEAVAVFAGSDPTPPPDLTCQGKKATIVGTAGNDVLTGTTGRDVIIGLGGNDRIRGLQGRDLICAGDGDDIVNGGKSRDRIAGGAGNDTLHGGNGPDRLSGGDGNDKLFGGNGPDALNGGAGTDTGDGGPGKNFYKDVEQHP